jgi:choline dehydrogenase-like flavoprotein
MVVRTVNERGDRVVVQGHHFETRTTFEVSASRVYLAAGVIPTTGILLRSLSAYDRPVLMKDSQYFLLPVLLPRAVTGVQTESMQTLSQIFLELIDPAISRHTVHLQVYSYSDPIGKALRSAMGPLAGPLEFVPRALEGRLLLFQGFIHSADSSEIEVRLTRAASGDERLVLKAVRHAQARSVVRRVVRRLVSQSWTLGVVPLPMAVQFAEPGRSFHSGGTFPMRQQPTTFETDVWGRPAGWRRVHAVDASVMPSVPATTITFTVMANAHRIGWETAAAAMNTDAVA